MKKITFLFITIFVLFSFASCKDSDNSNVENKNKIFYSEMTQEEKDIVSLIGVNSNIAIYDYLVDDTYNSVSIWLETYEDGKLIATGGKMSLDIQEREGRIAINANKNPNYKWILSHENGVGIGSGSFDTKNDFETDSNYSMSYGTSNKPISIDNDKEIILAQYLFEDNDSISVYDNQYYMDHPEVLEEYDYVYLIKCKFSKKTPNELH